MFVAALRDCVCWWQLFCFCWWVFSSFGAPHLHILASGSCLSQPVQVESKQGLPECMGPKRIWMYHQRIHSSTEICNILQPYIWSLQLRWALLFNPCLSLILAALQSSAHWLERALQLGSPLWEASRGQFPWPHHQCCALLAEPPWVNAEPHSQFVPAHHSMIIRPSSTFYV